MFTASSKIACFGISGCGKTFLSQYIQNIYPRKIIFDTVNEYIPESTDIVVSDFRDFGNALIHHKNSDKFRIIIKNDVENITEQETFDEMLRCIYYRGSVIISIDEIQNFSDTGAYGLSDWTERLFTFGRHADISIIFSTQRLGLLNKTLFSQCSHIFIGQIFEKNDLKNICNVIDIKEDLIKNLKKYEFILWQLSEPSTYKKVKIINNKLTEIK